LQVPRVAFPHLSQPRGHPAVLLRKLAVASRVLQVDVTTVAMRRVFGEIFIGSGGSVVTVPGCIQLVCRDSLGGPDLLPHPLGLFNDAEGVSGEPKLLTAIGPAVAASLGHEHFRSSTAGLTFLAWLKPAMRPDTPSG
jgi:hypothetical protein